MCFQACVSKGITLKLSCQVKWEEKEITTWSKYARLAIYDNVESVRTKKAVYSFDIFMLTVELGSALSLWLGMYRF